MLITDIKENPGCTLSNFWKEQCNEGINEFYNLHPKSKKFGRMKRIMKIIRQRDRGRDNLTNLNSTAIDNSEDNTSFALYVFWDNHGHWYLGSTIQATDRFYSHQREIKLAAKMETAKERCKLSKKYKNFTKNGKSSIHFMIARTFENEERMRTAETTFIQMLKPPLNSTHVWGFNNTNITPIVISGSRSRRNKRNKLRPHMRDNDNSLCEISDEMLIKTAKLNKLRTRRRTFRQTLNEYRRKAGIRKNKKLNYYRPRNYAVLIKHIADPNRGSKINTKWLERFKDKSTKFPILTLAKLAESLLIGKELTTARRKIRIIANSAGLPCCKQIRLHYSDQSELAALKKLREIVIKQSCSSVRQYITEHIKFIFVKLSPRRLRKICESGTTTAKKIRSTKYHKPEPNEDLWDSVQQLPLNMSNPLGPWTHNKEQIKMMLRAVKRNLVVAEDEAYNHEILIKTIDEINSTYNNFDEIYDVIKNTNAIKGPQRQIIEEARKNDKSFDGIIDSTCVLADKHKNRAYKVLENQYWKIMSMIMSDGVFVKSNLSPQQAIDKMNSELVSAGIEIRRLPGIFISIKEKCYTGPGGSHACIKELPHLCARRIISVCAALSMKGKKLTKKHCRNIDDAISRLWKTKSIGKQNLRNREQIVEDFAQIFQAFNNVCVECGCPLEYITRAILDATSFFEQIDLEVFYKAIDDLTQDINNDNDTDDDQKEIEVESCEFIKSFIKSFRYIQVGTEVYEMRPDCGVHIGGPASMTVAQVTLSHSENKNHQHLENAHTKTIRCVDDIYLQSCRCEKCCIKLIDDNYAVPFEVERISKHQDDKIRWMDILTTSDASNLLITRSEKDHIEERIPQYFPFDTEYSAAVLRAHLYRRQGATESIRIIELFRKNGHPLRFFKRVIHSVKWVPHYVKQYIKDLIRIEKNYM